MFLETLPKVAQYGPEWVAQYRRNKHMANAVTEYAIQGCDILVCALSTNPKKVRANSAIDQYEHVRFNKTSSSPILTELEANGRDKNRILEFIG